MYINDADQYSEIYKEAHTFKGILMKYLRNLSPSVFYARDSPVALPRLLPQQKPQRRRTLMPSSSAQRPAKIFILTR